MGKDHRYQGANQADRWRKRAGRRMPSRRMPRPLLGLIFLGVGTLAAAVTQFAIQSTAGQQSTAGLQSTITNWTEPLPGPMQGRASVIDGEKGPGAKPGQFVHRGYLQTNASSIQQTAI